MTFDKQLENAKKKKLQSRITRDIVFIVLGLIFLAISVFCAVKEHSQKKNNQKEKITTTTSIIKKIK